MRAGRAGSSGARSVRRRIGGKSGNRRLATPTHAVPRRGQREARVRRFKNDARVRHADGSWRAVARGLTECDTRPGAGRAEADISGRALVEGPLTGGNRAHADCVPLGGSRTGASSEHVLADERGRAAGDGARRRTSGETVGGAVPRLDHRSRPHQPNADRTLLDQSPPGNSLVRSSTAGPLAPVSVSTVILLPNALQRKVESTGPTRSRRPATS